MALLLIGILGIAFLGFPGWFVARAHGLRLPALLGLLAGALALVTLILLLQLAGARLSALNVGIGWAAWGLAAAWFGRRTAESPSSAPPAPAPLRITDLWPWLIALPTLAAVFYRVLAHPLFGVDTPFRWEFLAAQMWQRGTLSFYPPVSPADFEIYAWPDGIPPLVSSLYFALYCLADGVKPAVTNPLVIGQFILLLAATGALGRRLFAPTAANWAIALLGATPLAAWATAMGQETGIIALALVGLFLYLPAHRAEETRAAMIASGLALAVAALAREYGWALVLLGLGLAWKRGLSRRGLVALTGVVVVTAVPWYARNFILTGNPLYNLSLAGLFPFNSAHAALMTIYREHFALSQQLAEWGAWPFLNCAVVAIATGLGLIGHLRRTWSLALAILLVGVVWLNSVGYTAAGLMFSLRVLNPALALGAVIGGAALADLTATKRAQRVAFLLLALIGVDAALHTLVLPDRPYRHTPAEWLTSDAVSPEAKLRQEELLRAVARHVGHGRLLALGPNHLFARFGVAAVPPWSPDVAFIFDATLPPAVIWRQLAEADVRHVLISKGDLNRQYLEASPAFQASTERNLKVLLDTPDFVLFAIVDPRRPATT